MENRTIFEIRAVIPKTKDEGSKAIATKEQRKQAPQTKKKAEEIATPDLTSGFVKTISAGATIYASSQVIVNPLLKEQVNRAAVAGDYVQSANIQRTQQRVNQYVNLGLEVGLIAGTFLVNPILAGGMALGSVSRHTQQAISRNQQNRALKHANDISNYINSFESARFVDVKAGR